MVGILKGIQRALCSNTQALRHVRRFGTSGGPRRKDVGKCNFNGKVPIGMRMYLIMALNLTHAYLPMQSSTHGTERGKRKPENFWKG